MICPVPARQRNFLSYVCYDNDRTRFRSAAGSPGQAARLRLPGRRRGRPVRGGRRPGDIAPGGTAKLRTGLALGAGLAVYAAGMASLTNLLAALYFSQLLSNTALSWTLRGKRGRTFALGLTLFVGCDACVGLYNVLPLASPLYPTASVGMWFFYLPSQVLIALSARPEKEDAL